MRSTLLAVFTTAGLLAATSAFADTMQVPATAQTVAMKDAGDEVVCKAIVHEGITNGRIVCHTRKQWERIRNGIDQQINDFQLRALTTPIR